MAEHAKKQRFLLPGDRQGRPYCTLAPVTVKTLNNVAIEYSHVVSYERLRMLFNTTVSRWDTLVARQLLAAIATNAQNSVMVAKDPGDRNRTFTAGQAPVRGSMADVDLHRGVALAGDMTKGKGYRHDDTAGGAPGWDDLAILITWLPGNLFQGPANRGDNPGSDIDAAAREIVPKSLWDQLKVADSLIQDFVAVDSDNAKKNTAERAFAALAHAARKASPALYGSAQWGLDGDRRPIFVG